MENKKIVREVIDVINAEGKTRKEKLATLKKIDFSGRPGKDAAIAEVRKYEEKFQDYELRKITGKFPRGEARITGDHYYSIKWNIRTSWVAAFEKHLQKVAPYFNFSGANIRAMIQENWDSNFHDHYDYNTFRKYANKIRKEAIRISEKIKAEKAEKEKFSKETGLPPYFFKTKKTIEEVQKNKAAEGYQAQYMYCVLAGWNITVHQSVSEDWEYYSKSWHNSHGPKRTVESRYILFRNAKETQRVEVNSFAGNYLFSAIIDLLKVQKPKIKKAIRDEIKNFLAVQLNPYFDIEIIKKIGKIIICERKFAGEHYDYCITDGKNTFHDFSNENLVSGLKAKIQLAAIAEAKRLEAENEVLTAEIASRKYGFCYTGISEFAALNGLDYEGSYTVKQIREAVIQKRKLNCKKFQKELKTIGIILNCKQ